jgi:hypothetical protein
LNDENLVSPHLRLLLQARAVFGASVEVNLRSVAIFSVHLVEISVRVGSVVDLDVLLNADVNALVSESVAVTSLERDTVLVGLGGGFAGRGEGATAVVLATRVERDEDGGGVHLRERRR